MKYYPSNANYLRFFKILQSVPILLTHTLDVTDHNLVVAASQDILYNPSLDLIRKPKKIRQEQIDWESYKTLAEQDYRHYDDLVQQLRGDFKLKDMDTCVNKLPLQHCQHFDTTKYGQQHSHFHCNRPSDGVS